mmetsp:Transcript_6099/g.14804  ORF Transcript_6099/g.14804 Transcript_6099/m.14804 type:complete len:1142 (+) Transcript_6099:102-3527(+)
MLRVSEFCRGPLSPVPSSGSRRRRRPSFDHSDDSEGESCSTLEYDALSSIDTADDDEEEISCTVKLRAWNRPSSAACARIPLDVLKGLSLQDGDYAFLEKHQLAEMDEKITASRDTMLENVAIRLQLMDEDEELELTESMGAATVYANNHCLVPPIVLANLGVSPQTLWEQTIRKSFPLEEKAIVFRLRAIHDYRDDGSSNDDNVGIASPWLKRRNIATFKRRMKTAGRVLLRPLGRAPLWPWFSLTSSTTAKDNNDNQITQSQDGGSSVNLSSFERPKNSSTTAASVTKEEENEVKDAVWIYPSRSGVVLQESKLCEVRYNTNSNNVKQNVCYYEVLRIFSCKGEDEGEDEDDDEDKDKDEDENQDEDGLTEDQFYVTAPCTQFELDSCPLSVSALSYVRRLPLPSPSSSHDATVVMEGCDNGISREQPTEMSTAQINDPFVARRKLFSSSEISPEKDTTLDDLVFSCHPDWKKVATALLDAPPFATVTNDFTNGTSPDDSRILHIVGTDMEHDLEECVTTAASMVGMQCLSIKGLAAFGYEHRRSKGADGTSSSGVTVRSPMIEQQLAGVDAALEYVQKRRMEPCVLHISSVDEELASVATDDQLRCLIEDRLWSKWTEGLATISMKPKFEKQSKRKEIWGTGQRVHREDSNFGFDSLTENRWDYRYTPRILIVISTKRSLKKGPWLERLIFPSISLSLPDEKYINYLWNHSEVTNNNVDSISKTGNDEMSVLLSTEMMPLLRGRPAQEIIQLKQLMSAEMKGIIGKENFDDINISGNEEIQTDGGFQRLEKLCKDFDAGRRTASSDVSRISSVSWEDVGGLDHVRAEILDAIELPLKHPHLFPPNTGRSGILLFGPPGTGKTLVAKAVATECGLPFLSVKGPELLGSYIGESEANIREVFSSARLAAENNLPVRASILFFDELDSLAPKRGGNSNHGGGVMERVVASLLAELDGGVNHKDNHGRVFVLGATNRPDLLDPSLLRPGRLDRLVYLGIPTDNEERTRVLASQLRKMILEGDALEMARSIIEEGLPPRLSGADMSKLSSGAMLNAIRRLCREADRERDEILKKQQNGDKARVVTIDEILESWGEEKCTPVITLDDLRVAAKDVSSSVSDEEMQRYERLRVEHETSSNQKARA